MSCFYKLAMKNTILAASAADNRSYGSWRILLEAAFGDVA